MSGKNQRPSCCASAWVSSGAARGWCLQNSQTAVQILLLSQTMPFVVPSPASCQPCGPGPQERCAIAAPCTQLPLTPTVDRGARGLGTLAGSWSQGLHLALTATGHRKPIQCGPRVWDRSHQLEQEKAPPAPFGQGQSLFLTGMKAWVVGGAQIRWNTSCPGR